MSGKAVQCMLIWLPDDCYVPAPDWCACAPSPVALCDEE
ncbi:hypothetical protein PG1565B_1583 [Bifidobacterium pseudolongum subsp. globosum]|nr:hypothetical protein PG1565B_1583 [Bifidobacterium pseudolongum subsp. globosum]